MGLASDEQETTILFMRNEDFATIYTSDSTQITRLDKLCAAAPDMYKCIDKNEFGNKYICADKSLVSLRSKKVKRELTDEQRQAMADRLRGVRT